jgi:hypothetical protein
LLVLSEFERGDSLGFAGITAPLELRLRNTSRPLSMSPCLIGKSIGIFSTDFLRMFA